MSDHRETLARIRAQADAATEGPWEHYSINPRITPEQAVYSVPLDADPLARVSEVAGPVEPRDAEFIAHARTDVPRLVDALEAVLKVHKCLTFPDDGIGEPTACGHCDNQTWPCPTVTAITTALNGDDQ